MSPNEIIPAEPVKHGPPAGQGKLHHPPGTPSHHTVPATHAVLPPERAKLLEVPIDQASSLRLGLELLETKVAAEAEATEAKKNKTYERFREVRDRHPAVFEEAFQSLQNERTSLSGAEFYDRFYQGLSVISSNDPRLQGLAPADRVNALLFRTSDGAVPSLEEIVRIFRAGETVARGRALRPGSAPFLELYLALRWDQAQDGITVTDQVANRLDLDRFLIAAELIINLYDRMEKRIAQAAAEQSVARDTATKRLAEKKADAELFEKLRCLAAELRIAEERAAFRPREAPLVKLGRAVLRAQAELGKASLGAEVFLREVASGLSQFGSPGEFLESSLQLSHVKAVSLLTRAYRWGKLADLLNGLPVELQDNIKAILLPLDIPAAKIDEALAFLADPPRRESLELGYRCLSVNPKILANCFSLDKPLERLAAHGELGRQIRQALDAGDTATLIPALILSASLPEKEPLPAPPVPDLTKKYVIGHILRTAEPRHIPVLIETGDRALAQLSRRDQPLRQAVVWLIAETVERLCRDHQAVEILLQETPPPAPTAANLVEIRPIRQVTKQFVLNLMVASSHRPPPDNASAWPAWFKQAVRQVASSNRALSPRRDFQRQVVSLAARLASVRLSIDCQRPVEAREELQRALDEAVRHNLKLPQAPVLISWVYTGLLEKAVTGELKELPSLLGDPGSPGLSLSAANVSSVLAGEINTSLGKIPGISDDLAAEELLLQGLITRRVEYRPEVASAIVSLLKNRRIWARLLVTIRQQPAEAAGFVDRLIEAAEAIRVSEKSYGALSLRQNRPLHHSQVLHQALTEILTAPPDLLAETG